MGKYLDSIINRMEKEDISDNIQSEIIDILNNLKDNQGLAKLFKNLSERTRNFFDMLLELYIAYGLEDYRPKYEVKYINDKRPDFTMEINSQKVLVEVKRKDRAESEVKLFKKFHEIEPKMISILDKKSHKKYACFLHFSDIPKNCKLDGLLHSIPQRIKGISGNKIEEGATVVLHKTNNYEISLKFILPAAKWDICIESSAYLNDYFTFELLKDMLTGKNGLMSKFEKRNPQDITIGIIDPTSRSFILGVTETSFDLSRAKCLLKNIMDIDPKLKNDPNRIECNWYYEIRDNIDVIFLIYKRWSNLKDIKFEKFISNKVNKDKIPVINQIYQKLASPFQRELQTSTN